MDFQFGHREVCNVRRGQYCTGSNRRRSYQAVCLVQGCAHRRVLSTPATGAPAFRGAQWGRPQRLHQATGRWFFFGAETPPNLFDGYRGHPRLDTSASQRPQTLRGGIPPERVDQYRRVE